MKKLLLTSVVAFCFGGIALAQAPAKVARKKAPLKTTMAKSQNAQYEARVKEKEARAKAIEEGKAVPQTSATKPKNLAVDKQANK